MLTIFVLINHASDDKPVIRSSFDKNDLSKYKSVFSNKSGIPRKKLRIEPIEVEDDFTIFSSPFKVKLSSSNALFDHANHFESIKCSNDFLRIINDTESKFGKSIIYKKQISESGAHSAIISVYSTSANLAIQKAISIFNTKEIW